MKAVRRAALFLALGLSLPDQSHAVEGGIETYLLGSRDSMAGTLPPPGTDLQDGNFRARDSMAGTLPPPGTYLNNDFVYFPQSGLKPPTLVGKTFKRAPKALMNH